MNSLITWVGSKGKEKKRLIKFFPPAKSYRLYAEPFCCTASMFFEKERSDVEVLNDINHNIVNFFKVIRDKLDEFFDLLQFELSSRENFERYKKELVAMVDAESGRSLTDVELAVKFYVMNVCSYLGANQNFIRAVKNSEAYIHRLPRNFFKCRDRLNGVIIENLDFRKIFKMYDADDAFAFLDPPYRCPTSLKYPEKFVDSDFEDLRDILRGCKCRFLMTLNDSRKIREFFSEFIIEKYNPEYRSFKAQRQTGKELLISNYDIHGVGSKTLFCGLEEKGGKDG